MGLKDFLIEGGTIGGEYDPDPMHVFKKQEEHLQLLQRYVTEAEQAYAVYKAEALKQRLANLEAEKAILDAQKAVLEAENVKLETERHDLEAENAELKVEKAVLEAVKVELLESIEDDGLLFNC